MLGGLFKKYDRYIRDNRITNNKYIDIPITLKKNKILNTTKILFDSSELSGKINRELNTIWNLTYITNYVFSQILNNNGKVKLRKQNHSKEIDDIIGRLMNNSEITNDLILKFKSEVKDKFQVDISNEKLFCKNDNLFSENQGELIIYELSKLVVISFEFPSTKYYKDIMVLTQYGTRAKFLLDSGLSYLEVFYHTLRNYNLKSHSHTSFSIDSIQDIVKSDIYSNWGKIECFASIFNNQNYLLNGNYVDIIFALDEIPKLKIKGLFPNSLKSSVLELAKKYNNKVLLILNPVFGENIIINMFNNIIELIEDLDCKYINIEIFITIPWWDDLYENPIFREFSKRIIDVGYQEKWNKFKTKCISNFTIRRKSKFNYYQVFITKFDNF